MEAHGWSGDAAGSRGPLFGLTERESEVLERASLGYTNAQVAAALGITTHAVKFHLASIFRKLGVRNRTEAVVHYLRGSEGNLLGRDL